MRVRILGCSGGIGGELRTTSLLIDHDTLIDAGTGVGDLSLVELSLIDRVFITHSHLDHICMLALMLDSVGAMRAEALTVYATAETLAILRTHMFNWKIWPDFSEIPNKDQPFLRFVEIRVGEEIALPRGGRITAVPAVHTVPAVGYHLNSGHKSLVFSGDTTSNPQLWAVVNGIRNLKVLIIETAFCNRERELARLSKHLCPTLLAEELVQLRSKPEVYITHLKPGEIELTMQEILEAVPERRPRMLQQDQEFEL